MKAILARLLTILVLVMGTIGTVEVANKVIVTAVNLAAHNDNIRYYNEADRKTNEWTEQVLEEFEAREAYYESEDMLVRVYSTSPTVLKVLGVFLAIALYPALVWMWIYNLYTTYLVIKRAWQRKRRRRTHNRR